MGSGKMVPPNHKCYPMYRVDDPCAVFKRKGMRCGGPWVEHPYICQQEEVDIGLLVLGRAEFERTRTLHLVTYVWLTTTGSHYRQAPYWL